MPTAATVVSNTSQFGSHGQPDNYQLRIGRYPPVPERAAALDVASTPPDF
jgi:hypothetical protein